MKRLIYKVFILSVLAGPAALGQVRDTAETPLEEAAAALERLAGSRPQEKLYLHFDKPYYAAGDDIWFRAYLVDASTHRFSELSKIVHVELINPADTVVQSLALKKDRGNFNGSFRLSDSLPSGNYRIRAYTSWMRNFGADLFFTKYIMIGNRRLSNLRTHIEYEINRESEPPQIKAAIRFLDENGRPVAGKDVSYEQVLIGRKGTREAATTDENGIIRVPVPYNESALYPNKYICTSINFDGLPFVKNFFLPSFSPEIDLQFFPEGGNLIAGIPNVVAFKAVDASGMGKEVKGIISD
ncbi:MAG TPA: MG2 domain-containing protein, partial [Anseongella sp.]|nr:MG2 domain-containing protein [Anseongella sp.]